MTLSREQLKRLGNLHKEIATIYLEASNETEVNEAPVVVPKEESKVVELPVNKEEESKVVELPVDKKEEETTVSEKAEEMAEEKSVEEKGKEAVNLEGLTYNELKKLAKELGLSAKGTKAELVMRIQEAQGVEVADEDEDEEEVVVDEPQVEEPTTEEESEEDDETETDEEEVEESDEEEELPTTLHDEVMEQLEDYTDDELKEILESIDKPTKGKRQTLIALIVQAIEDGELDFGDDEEESEEEVEETEPTETEEVDTESDDEEEEETDEDEVEEEDDEDEEGLDLEEVLEPMDRDEVKAICRKLEIKVLKKDTAESLKDKVMEFEDTDKLMEVLVDLGIIAFEDDELEEDEEEEVDTIEPNYTGSKERIKAMKKVYNTTLEELEEGDITPKQVKTLLDKYHNGTWKGTQEENNLEYARIMAELVDDDGDQVDLEEAYYVGDNVYCCGAELKDVDGDYYCEHCGTTYTNED